MKRILILLMFAITLDISVCDERADAVFWFWYNPTRALSSFAENYLTDNADFDLNHDGWVDMIDYAIMVKGKE